MTPWRTRAYVFSMVLPLKGSLPHSAANRITPIDHTSTDGPKYLTPVMISGAAYLGEPQNVSNSFSLSYRFDRPKSMILIFFRSSSRMFSVRTHRERERERSVDTQAPTLAQRPRSGGWQRGPKAVALPCMGSMHTMLAHVR
jgi:hypothetical protein